MFLTAPSKTEDNQTNLRCLPPSLAPSLQVALQLQRINFFFCRLPLGMASSHLHVEAVSLCCVVAAAAVPAGGRSFCPVSWRIFSASRFERMTPVVKGTDAEPSNRAVVLFCRVGEDDWHRQAGRSAPAPQHTEENERRAGNCASRGHSHPRTANHKDLF